MKLLFLFPLIAWCSLLVTPPNGNVFNVFPVSIVWNEATILRNTPTAIFQSWFYTNEDLIFLHSHSNDRKILPSTVSKGISDSVTCIFEIPTNISDYFSLIVRNEVFQPNSRCGNTLTAANYQYGTNFSIPCRIRPQNCTSYNAFTQGDSPVTPNWNESELETGEISMDVTPDNMFKIGIELLNNGKNKSISLTNTSITNQFNETYIFKFLEIKIHKKGKSSLMCENGKILTSLNRTGSRTNRPFT